MAQTTGISWTDHTFNPWWGCVKVSPACTNCYAERDSKRYGHDVWGSSSRRRFFSEKHWQEPLKWNKKAAADGVRRRVFCASMADVFEVLPDGHPDAEQMTNSRDDLMVLICETPSLDWLLLTKRPEEMARYFSDRPVPDNVIAMTTAENQEWLDKRINHLLAVPARRRGLSLEPLLGPIRLDQCAPHILGGDDSNPGVTNAFSGMSYHPATIVVTPPTEVTANGVQWVIVGGESGPKARPTHPDWLRSLRNQCVTAGASFHFKQWGEWMPFPTNTIPFPAESAAPICLVKPDGHVIRPYTALDAPGAQMVRVGKKAAGRMLDGRTWDEFPEAPGA